jgi:AcrR family transcriptional regulator
MPQRGGGDEAVKPRGTLSYLGPVLDLEIENTKPGSGVFLLHPLYGEAVAKADHRTRKLLGTRIVPDQKQRANFIRNGFHHLDKMLVRSLVDALLEPVRHILAEFGLDQRPGFDSSPRRGDDGKIGDQALNAQVAQDQQAAHEEISRNQGSRVGDDISYIGMAGAPCQWRRRNCRELARRIGLGHTGTMSTPFTSDLAARKGYHHGNLRDALIEAARQLLAERGAQGFTLVDAARRAGVSPAAPYRHFRDKDALLAEVALGGFKTFAARQHGALAGHADPIAAFRAMGLAYLAFAQDEPGAYAAMFMGQHTGPVPDGMADSGFEALVKGLRPLVGDPPPQGLDPLKLAGQVWALCHGVAMLSASGQLQNGFGVKPQELLLEGVERLVRGALKT